MMITKRKLGLIFIAISAAGAAGSFAYDLINPDPFNGVGPAQQYGLLAAGVLFLVGLTLLPLGDRPA